MRRSGFQDQAAARPFQIHQVQALFELRRPEDELPVTVHDQGAAVEHQFILAADQVDVNNGDIVVRGAPAQQFPAHGGLVGVVRRGVDIDQQFRPCLRRFPCVVFGPQVLTHAQRDLEVGRFNQVQVRPLGKIALFVEYPVIGQVPFVVGGDDLPVPDQAAGVIQALSGCQRVAEDHVYAPRCAQYPLQGLFYLHVEMGAQQQVLRRVAGQGQFRENYGIGAGRVPGPGDVFKHQFRIAVHVSDTRVYLRDGDSFHRSLAAMASPSAAGDLTVVTPAASSAENLSPAAPLPPEMIAPAWPMRLPGGAVTPAI